MFVDTDIRHELLIKSEPPKDKKPYKPSNKQIFKDYKIPNKKAKAKK